MSTTTRAPGVKSATMALWSFLVSSVLSSSFTSTLPLLAVFTVKTLLANLNDGAHNVIKSAVRKSGRGGEEPTV